MDKDAFGNIETACTVESAKSEQTTTAEVQHDGGDVPQYLPHPYADLLPQMDTADTKKLVRDIKANGLREPITLSKDGRILDGRHRYAACIEAEVKPHFVPYEGDDELAFVISKNLHRRHLTTSQRGMIAAKLSNMKKGDNQHTKEDTAIAVTSQAGAAELMNVSVDTLQRAKVVNDSGDVELIKKVTNGEMPVSKAEKMVKSDRLKEATPDVAENVPPPVNNAHVENCPEACEDNAQAELDGVEAEQEDHLPASVGTPLSTWQKKMRLSWSQTSQKERDLFEAFIFDFKKAALVRLAEKS
jgi:ParB-like chromosome segregation protein Spo0J